MADINSINFDVKNPAKTLASMAKIDEPQAEKFLSDMPLTDYVAIVNAIESKDLRRISEIVGKHKLAEKQYHEAIDYKVKQELGKISQKVSQQAAVNKVMPVISTPAGTPSASTAAATNKLQGNETVVDADAKTGTIAIQDPATKKTTIKSTNDPNNNTLISALVKNAGL